MVKKKKLAQYFISALTIISALLVSNVSFAQANNFSPAIRVNTDVITHYEIDQMQLLLEAVGVQPQDSLEAAREFLIQDRLSFQALARIGAADIEQILIDRSLEDMAGGPDNLENMLADFDQRGINDQVINTYVGAQIRKNSILQISGQNNNSGSDEISASKLTIEPPTNEFVKFREIVLAYEQFGGELPTNLEAKKITDAVNAGQSFEEIASQISVSNTRENGGLIEAPTQALIENNPELYNMLTALAPGEVSKPFNYKGQAAILIMLEEFYTKSLSLPRIETVSYVKAPLQNNAEAKFLVNTLASCDNAKALANAEYHEDIVKYSLPQKDLLSISRLASGKGITDGEHIYFLCASGVKTSDELEGYLNTQSRVAIEKAKLDAALAEIRATANITYY